ncbi:MAG: Mpo1-like protein [Isosphaeraceae bacterium]|nr:Mpo1-like protein [Isosphaeraceae bacterium]
MERHRRPSSFVLHIIGIPPTILGVLLIPIYLLAGSISLFLFALALFVGGYAIQFLGHAIEGSDPGEVILLKRKLGLPYVEIAPPRSQPSTPA